MRSLLLLLWLLVGLGSLAAAQPQPDASAFPYYVVSRQARVYDAPNDRRPSGRLRFREAVVVLQEEEGWSHIRREDGTTGWAISASLSNLWLRVDKSRRTLYVYQGSVLVRTLPVDLGQNPVGTKIHRAAETDTTQWRTPEGAYFVTQKLPNSAYYKAFLLNYPSVPDAERGRAAGLISAGEYTAILRAAERLETPPMNTALGGMIEIHGHGTGGKSDWTRGCVAIRDAHMDWLWEKVQVGTPVLIDP